MAWKTESNFKISLQFKTAIFRSLIEIFSNLNQKLFFLNPKFNALNTKEQTKISRLKIMLEHFSVLINMALCYILSLHFKLIIGYAVYTLSLGAFGWKPSGYLKTVLTKLTVTSNLKTVFSPQNLDTIYHTIS